MDPQLARVVEAAETAAAELLADGAVPGLAVSVVRDGRRAWSAGFGHADPASGRTVTPDTLFRIASVTKPFTAIAVLQLRDEGRLALHDPLVRHLPEAAAFTDPFGVLDRITIRQVLLHIAGLPNGVPMDDPAAYPAMTQDDLLARLHRVRLARPPDTQWHYSNLGYELLAILVARLAGEDYAMRLRRTVLEPAGLADTVYHPSAEQRRRSAVGVLAGGRAGAWTRAPDLDSDHLLGDGGLWSTVDDLARWIEVTVLVGDDDRRGIDGRVLDGPTLRELQRPLALVDLDGWTSAQGPGWASFRVGRSTWQGHTGSIHGFRSIALLRAAEGLGVAVLVNGPRRPTEVAHAVARALLPAAVGGVDVVDRAVGAGVPPPALVPPPPVSLPDRAPPRAVIPDGPVGSWAEREFGWSRTVSREAGQLVLHDHEAEVSATLETTGDPLTWCIGGDAPAAGELVRYAPATPDRDEALNVAGFPFRRAGD